VNVFLFDASALVKRFIPEPGTPLINHLFGQSPRDRLMCSMLGAAEVAAAIIRKANSNQIAPAHFANAMTQLRTEVLDAADFDKLPADNSLIESAIPYWLLTPSTPRMQSCYEQRWTLH
jgi:predicted nucleic acid-binding protein